MNSKHYHQGSRQADPFNAGHFQGQNRRAPLNHFAKTRIILGLCLVMGAGCMSVRAVDNPAQAAARAALVQKLNDLDQPQTMQTPRAPRVPRALRIPVSTNPSGIVVKQRRLYAAIGSEKC